MTEEMQGDGNGRVDAVAVVVIIAVVVITAVFWLLGQ